MRLKGWTVAAGLALFAPAAPHAATDANSSANTTGDLVELCTAALDTRPGYSLDPVGVPAQ